MKKIRVGLIRCDVHAIYYATLMDRHDPLLLKAHRLSRSGKIKYSWQTGGVHFYHYMIWNDQTRMTAPRVSGFRIARLWDEDKDVAETASDLFYGKPKVCETFEEASDDVDMVFIADCDGDGSDHLRLAAPGLKKRVPTFVDKPFAYDVRDAKAIVRLAERYRTPVLSLSILRTVPHATRFRARFDEIGGPRFGLVVGGGVKMAGQIHAISLAQHVFGDGVTSVSCMGNTPLAYVHLEYGGKRGRPPAGVVLNCAPGPGPHAAFYVSAYGPEGAIHSPQIGDFVFPWGAARNLEIAKQMVRTGRPPVPYSEIIENIAVAEAARKAQKLGRALRLSEVWR